MTMKREFCDQLVDECEEQIEFPTYDDPTSDDTMSYCDYHVGVGEDGDQFWSYPYTECEFAGSINEGIVYTIPKGGDTIRWKIPKPLCRLR